MEDVGRDYLAKMKRNLGHFKAGGVYWYGDKFMNFDPYMADSYPSDIIPAFTNQDRLLIVRGGIGDLLALSILQNVAPEVTVLTSKSLFPVLDWWANPPKRKHFNEPLFSVKYPKKIEDYLNKYGQQKGDHIIAQGSPENWYEVISRSVNRPFLGGRPQLNIHKKPDYPNRLKPGNILIVNKATSRNRSASLVMLMEAVKEAAPDRTVYFYDADQCLNGADKTPIGQYLADLYYADFVLSVDTSAIHFREGIQKPALGLYSSFSAESRTKYYEYTKSIDIAGCDIAPCFKNLNPCPYAKAGYTHPPCMGMENELMTEQIVKQLKEML